ncbi:DOPA-like domain-containing protein [Aspergillus pseudocaelatus]|uniref:DOPA-like domain-containing protein n=1 Tax=Aspergillus pseudocaelatus TaxID=1825620 RepID=A0ABQ6WW94_9EURO|nr:DOPA-like domain-containing protein [Aspergillus pseudocaelatus]
MNNVLPYNFDSGQYSYDSPLKGWKSSLGTKGSNLEDKVRDDGDARPLSEAYDRFTLPISNGGRGDTQLPGFDVHIYFDTTNDFQSNFAAQLWKRIDLEFPELRLYPIQYKPSGPHRAGMFEVALFTPTQFGAFVSWLVINRGPLSALIHPNTDDELRDHIQRFAWLGPEVPLNMDLFRLRPEAELLDSKNNIITKVWVEGTTVKTKRVKVVECTN